MKYNETHLMAAKICHDFATPLSAMTLLLDLAFEKCTDPHIEAAFRESVEKSTFRLQFYRLLLTINEDQPACTDVYALLMNYAKSLKVHLTLPIECADGGGARLLLGLTYILIEGLTRGGTVDVVFAGDSLRLTARGAPIHLRPGYGESLENYQSQVHNARNILPCYLGKLAKSLMVGINVSVVKDERITFETKMLA